MFGYSFEKKLALGVGIVAPEADFERLKLFHDFLLSVSVNPLSPKSSS